MTLLSSLLLPFSPSSALSTILPLCYYGSFPCLKRNSLAYYCTHRCPLGVGFGFLTFLASLSWINYERLDGNSLRKFFAFDFRHWPPPLDESIVYNEQEIPGSINHHYICHLANEFRSSLTGWDERGLDTASSANYRGPRRNDAMRTATALPVAVRRSSCYST